MTLKIALLVAAAITDLGPVLSHVVEGPAVIRRVGTAARRRWGHSPEKFPRTRRSQPEPRRRRAEPREVAFAPEVPRVATSTIPRAKASRSHGQGGAKAVKRMDGPSAKVNRHPKLAIVTKPLWTKKKKK